MNKCETNPLNFMSKKHYRIKDQVYKIHLDFFIGCTEREWLDYLAKCNDDFENLEEHNVQGRNITNNKVSSIWVDGDLSLVDSISVISHEVIHHILGGLNYRGIPITFKNEEVIAYLHEFFLREILNRLFKKMKKCKVNIKLTP